MWVNATVSGGVPAASYVIFPLIMLTDAAYILLAALNETTRRKPHYALRLATVVIMFLHASFMLSAHMGTNEIVASWINTPGSCDVIYVLTAAFHDLIMVLFIAVIAERVHDVRIYLYSSSWTMASVVIATSSVICIIWEAIIQQVLSDGATVQPLDDTYQICILNALAYPLYTIYALQEVLLLSTLYTLSVCALIMRLRMGGIADEVTLPAVTGLIVTLFKAPHVILFVGDIFWNAGYEVTFVLYYVGMFTSILVPLIWLLADPWARSGFNCSPTTKYDIENEKSEDPSMIEMKTTTDFTHY